MIVVTGARGFIGHCIIRLLGELHRSSDLLAVDHPSVVDDCKHHPGAPFVDHAGLLELLRTGRICPKVIVHMGACSSTTETNWDYLRRNNLEYSRSLYSWCAENDKCLIYASSAATYGDGSRGFDDESDLSQFEPLNLYGKSKHAFDLWVQDQVASGGPRPAQCVGFKFFNVFGPGEAHKGRMASMVYHSFHQVRSSGSVRLFKSHRPDYEDGGQLRDFIYIDQVVDVILQCVANPAINGLFNLGTGRARSFKDLALAVFQAMNVDPQIDYIPMPEDLQGKYQYFTQATMEKARRAGLRLPEISLEDAVADYVSRLEAESSAIPSGASA